MVSLFLESLARFVLQSLKHKQVLIFQRLLRIIIKVVLNFGQFYVIAANPRKIIIQINNILTTPRIYLSQYMRFWNLYFRSTKTQASLHVLTYLKYFHAINFHMHLYNMSVTYLQGIKRLHEELISQSISHYSLCAVVEN